MFLVMILGALFGGLACFTKGWLLAVAAIGSCTCTLIIAVRVAVLVGWL